ncbi:MAG: TerC family protein [Burkholderiaceae bacterium]
MEFGSTEFWVALGKIIWINILLSGDNAVVIALAARALPAKQQKQAIAIGSGAAIVMRIVLTIVAVQLLTLPWLKVVGAALLIYIGVSLLMPEDHEDGGGKASNAGMLAAVRTILIADLVMSLDNVLAVAAAANGNMPLLIIGLAISIPLVIFGSTLLLKVIERLPVIVWLGAALLGYIAGEIFVTDPATHATMTELATSYGLSESALHHLAGAVGAVLVLVIAKVLQMRHAAKSAHA